MYNSINFSIKSLAYAALLSIQEKCVSLFDRLSQKVNNVASTSLYEDPNNGIKSIEISDKKRLEIINLATSVGCNDVVKFYLTDEFQISRYDSKILLLKAVKSGRSDVVESILNESEVPETTMSLCLNMAAINKNEDILRSLLSCETKIRDEDLVKAYIEISNDGCSEIMNLLLKRISGEGYIPKEDLELARDISLGHNKDYNLYFKYRLNRDF